MSVEVGHKPTMSRPIHLGLTVALGLLLAVALYALVQWGLVHAVWQPDAQACLNARGVGACWGVIA